ncbi:hypothetical protein CAPTEDRAFT_212129 [Capitella teleta]|uniref:Uncharacterized protein n=1 Tax=Capitella teleta TaxID=283909 RepID=R7T812_CAPTE|nr:hypothetical protein CAPTEDRAFT_212129 [Capitella teleta]|eukprot:ELT87129.1 hypothetical protein CAPTEDRAFT_212129 [Capitella teleta]
MSENIPPDMRRTGSATGLCVFLRLTVDQRLSKPDFLIIEFNLTPSKRVCEESFKSASRLRLHEAACKSKKLKRCYELAQENTTTIVSQHLNNVLKGSQNLMRRKIIVFSNFPWNIYVWSRIRPGNDIYKTMIALKVVEGPILPRDLEGEIFWTLEGVLWLSRCFMDIDTMRHVRWLVERHIASQEQLDICTDNIARLQEEYKVPLNVLNLNKMIVEEQESFRKSSNHASGHDWRSRYTKGAALSLRSDVYSHEELTDAVNHLPTAARRQWLDSHFLRSRAQEEMLMCIEEMQILHNFLREKEKDLDQKIDQMKMAASEFDVGVRAQLLSECFKIPKRIDECQKTVQNNLLTINSNF